MTASLPKPPPPAPEAPHLPDIFDKRAPKRPKATFLTPGESTGAGTLLTGENTQ